MTLVTPPCSTCTGCASSVAFASAPPATSWPTKPRTVSTLTHTVGGGVEGWSGGGVEGWSGGWRGGLMGGGVEWWMEGWVDGWRGNV